MRLSESKLRESIGKNFYNANKTYFRRVLRVVCLIMQHCKMGAKIEISSWKGLPNPLP